MNAFFHRFISFLLLVLLLANVVVGQQVRGVEAVGFTVTEMDRSVEFYTHVLHFQKASDQEFVGEQIEHLKGVFGARVRVVRLRLGDETLQLSQYLAPEGRPIPVDSKSNDGWFQHVAIVVRDMDEAYAWLRKNNVRHASPGPQTLPTWNPNAGGIRAFYFRDPDGHNLEVLWFPEGKGAAKWHRATRELFLGVDHTAIVVRDTEASLVLYRDVLGMKVVGTSENYGPEQERLNNVFGARLRITSLRAESGAGIELLEYLAPKNGRPAPDDMRANDIAHWETLLTTDCAACGWKALTGRHVRLVSSDVEPENGDENRVGFAFADPDGHVLELISGNATEAKK